MGRMAHSTQEAFARTVRSFETEEFNEFLKQFVSGMAASDAIGTVARAMDHPDTQGATFSPSDVTELLNMTYQSALEQYLNDNIKE